MNTGNPFIDLPKPEGPAKIRHPRHFSVFVECQMQSGPPARWAFIAHTGIALYVPGVFDTRDEVIAAVDAKIAESLASVDFAEVEARIAVYHGIDFTADPMPTDPVERDRWKARNYFKLYGTTGKLKDLLK